MRRASIARKRAPSRVELLASEEGFVRGERIGEDRLVSRQVGDEAKICELEARRHGASEETVTAQWSSRLPMAGGNHIHRRGALGRRSEHRPHELPPVGIEAKHSC